MPMRPQLHVGTVAEQLDTWQVGPDVDALDGCAAVVPSASSTTDLVSRRWGEQVT